LGMGDIVKVAILCFGPDSHFYRVFFDAIGIPDDKFAHFIVTFLLVCRMNQNLTKLWKDDDINTRKYLAPKIFNRILKKITPLSSTPDKQQIIASRLRSL